MLGVSQSNMLDNRRGSRPSLIALDEVVVLGITCLRGYLRVELGQRQIDMLRKSISVGDSRSSYVMTVHDSKP